MAAPSSRSPQEALPRLTIDTKRSPSGGDDWPESSSPQQTAVPSSLRAHVEREPAADRREPLAVRRIGLALVVVVVVEGLLVTPPADGCAVCRPESARVVRAAADGAEPLRRRSRLAGDVAAPAHRGLVLAKRTDVIVPAADCREGLVAHRRERYLLRQVVVGAVPPADGSGILEPDRAREVLARVMAVKRTP